MQIILVHPRFAQAKTLRLSANHYLIACGLFALLVIGAALLLYYCSLRYAVHYQLPLVRSLFVVGSQDPAARQDKYIRENLDVMAVKLGEIQAQLTRLDALGERVSSLAGIKPQEFNFKELPGRGGSAPAGQRSLSLEEFQQQLKHLASRVDYQSDYLNVVETELMHIKLKSKMMPTMQPVAVTYNASGFGWRLDPITGQQAMHQGIDFVAAVGTPIVAAAGGVVIASEWRHDYGNMIDIDHGNDIVTRYAHASKVYVKVGDIVRRNQHIADVGTSGRSTGAHLHFEIHVRGVAQNPAKFLESNNG